eukprot:Awhi_evm1s12675
MKSCSFSYFVISFHNLFTGSKIAAFSGKNMKESMALNPLQVQSKNDSFTTYDIFEYTNTDNLECAVVIVHPPTGRLSYNHNNRASR